MRYLILSFFLVSQSAFGINLQEALSFAYTNNPEFTQNKLEFLKSIEAFPKAFSQAFLPDIGLNIQNSEEGKPGQFKERYTNIQEIQKNIYISQSLFNSGGGIAAVSAAKEQFYASKYKFFDEEQKIFIKNIQLYFNCYAAKKKYEISIINLNFLTKEYEAAKERLRLGESTKTEVAYAKMRLSESEYYKSVAFASLQSQNAIFYKKNGIDLTNERLEIPEILDDEIAFTLEEIMALSANNYNIKQKKHELKSAKSDVRVASSKLLPSVILNSSYSIVDKTNKNLQKNVKGEEFQVSLSLHVPIFPKGGEEYSNVRLANKALRQTALAQDQMLKENEVQAISLWSGLNAEKMNLSYLKHAIHAAETALEGTKKEYAEGMRDLLDVIKTEKELYNFKINLIDSTTKYFEKLYQLKALLGELTAEKLKLNVKYFNPDREFNKFKIISF